MIKIEYLFMGITMTTLTLPLDASAQHDHSHEGHYRPDTTALQRTQRLGEVVVRGKYVDRVNKSAYNAVAIDTRKLRNTNLDLAHALDRVAGIKIREEGGVGSAVQLNLYSDNDYKVKTQWTDLSTSTISNEEQWFRRFHDRYHNEAVVLQAGLVNKPWANKLLFGFQYTHEYAQVQNANLMKIVFGGKLRKNWGVTPSLLYEKRNLFTRGLNLRLSARYDYTTTNNVDTLSRTYSWTGQWIPKASQGEGATSLAEFTGKTLTAVANLTYRIGDQHFFTLNKPYINFHRHTTENAANRAMTLAAHAMGLGAV